MAGRSKAKTVARGEAPPAGKETPSDDDGDPRSSGRALRKLRAVSDLINVRDPSLQDRIQLLVQLQRPPPPPPVPQWEQQAFETLQKQKKALRRSPSQSSSTVESTQLTSSGSTRSQRGLQTTSSVGSRSTEDPAWGSVSEPSIVAEEDLEEPGRPTPLQPRARQSATWETCENWLLGCDAEARAWGLRPDALEHWASNALEAEEAKEAEVAKGGAPAAAAAADAARQPMSTLRRAKDGSARALLGRNVCQTPGLAGTRCNIVVEGLRRNRAVVAPASGPRPLPGRHLTVHQQRLKNYCMGKAVPVACIPAEKMPRRESPLPSQRPFSIAETDFPTLTSQPHSRPPAGPWAPARGSPPEEFEHANDAAEQQAPVPEEAATDPCVCEPQMDEEECEICGRPLSVSSWRTLSTCQHSFHLGCLARRQNQEGTMQCMICGVPFRWDRVRQSKPRAASSVEQAQQERAKIMHDIFLALAPGMECGAISCRHLQRFAVLTGFQGTDEEFEEEFARLCVEWRLPPTASISEQTFFALVDCDQPHGCYCSDVELQGILQKLDEANARRRSVTSKIFKALSEGHLTLYSDKLRQFRELCSFEVSDETWFEEHLPLLAQYMGPQGFDEVSFQSLVNDCDGLGCYCSDEDLAYTWHTLSVGTEH
mmetsp:Transcript_1033/g.3515  ORF Transcript_1033/g.3515 Transcript_1033/m.3515 type:complete len:654 (+) Transcript_1033:61-2022(+)